METPDELLDAGDIAPAPRRPARPANTEAHVARLLLWLIPTLALVLFFGVRLVVTSRASKAALGKRLGAEIANRTHSAVRMGGMSFGWAYQPCIHDLEIYRLSDRLELSAATKAACVDRWGSAVGSGFRAVRVKLDHPSILLRGDATKSGDEPLAEVAPEAATGTAAKSAKGPRAPLREFEILFHDLHLDWRSMPIPERIASGSLGPLDGALSIQRRGREAAVSIDVREPATGLSLRGRANPTQDGWDLAAGIEGDLAPSFGGFLRAGGLDIRRLPVRGELGVIYSATDRTVRLDLDLLENDVDVANEIVSKRRLAGFAARQKFRIDVDLKRSRLALDEGLFEVNGIPVVISLEVQGGRESPAFKFSADLRTVPLAKLLRAIPGAEIPPFVDRISPSVLFALSFSMAGELRDPRTWTPKLEYRVAGVGKEGEGSGLEDLRRSFEYHPLTAEGRAEAAVVMGPNAPSWTPYPRIPYAQRRAVQVSEDADFFLHNGVNIEEMRQAIIESVTTGKRTRGGSTLTQQLVKNLFLSRERTAARKIEEFVLTALVESALSKDKIFELYFNIIEWGPGVYGLKQAAEHYFARPPQALNPREMAYLASIIPGPLLYHRYFEEQRIPGKHLFKVDHLLERLGELGTLPADQIETLQKEPIRFVRRGKPAASLAADPGAQAPDEATPEE